MKANGLMVPAKLAENELLRACLRASFSLVSSQKFCAGVVGWLKEISQALGAGRGVIGSYEHSDSPTLVAMGEVIWSRDDLPPLQDLTIPKTTDFIEWRERLLRGEVVAAGVKDLKDPASRAFWKANAGVYDLLLPVFVDEVVEAWVCFEWHEPPHHPESSIPILQEALACLSAAISRRDQWQKAQAERESLAAERAERIAAHNAVLRNSAARLSAAADFQDVLIGSLAEIATVLGADTSHLFTYDDVSDTLTLACAWRHGTVSMQVDPSEPEVFSQRIPRSITDAFAKLCKSRRYFSLSKGELNGLEWPGVMAWLDHGGYKQAVALALMVGDRPLGILGFAFHREGDLTDQQGELLYALSAQMALALEFKRLADAMREIAIMREQEAASVSRAAEMGRTNEALLRCTEILAEESDLHPFLCALMAETTELTGAKSAGVFSYDERSEELRMVSFMTEGKPVSLRDDPRMAMWRNPMPKSTSDPWIKQLREHGFGRISLPESTSLSEQHPWVVSEQWHRKMGHQDIITVPLFAGGQMIGTFGQCFAETITESALDLNQTRLFASAAAVALQIAQLSRETRSAALDKAILTERNRIARDLHDTLAQGFTGVLAQLGAAEGALELGQATQVQHSLGRARALARRSLAEARASVHAMRPDLRARPMGERLQEMLSSTTEGTALKASLKESGHPTMLSPVADWCVHKFAQETLANTLKHAGANHFDLSLHWHENSLTVHASDDGIGFDHELSGRGIGLALMRERASEAGGRVSCQHGSNGGAWLHLEIPLTRISRL